MPELRFVRAHDRHLSLWQSAVAENIRAQLRGPDAAPSASDVLGHPLMSAANDHVEAALAGEPPTAPDPDAGDPRAIAAYLSRVGLENGKALADGDAERAAADVEFRKYSDEDPGFLSCATTYAKYYAEYKGVFAYNDWTKQGGGNINYGVVNYRLPNDARVGIVGDWGTGLGDAKGLLKDLMTAHSPAALIHLGDIYYSATPDECAVNYAGSEVEIKTTESAAGAHNVLGAWSTPTPYYYTPGSDWSRVYGSVYLTTKSGDPYYWVMRPAVPAR